MLSLLFSLHAFEVSSISFFLCSRSNLVKYFVSIKDGMLTKKEILDKHDIFVGSQVTDFGEALARHDEF